MEKRTSVINEWPVFITLIIILKKEPILALFGNDKLLKKDR